MGLTSIKYDDYRHLFIILHKAVQNVKLKAFQYRLLLGKIVTNIDLKCWGKTDSDLCSLCKKLPETPRHLFYECEIVQPALDYIIKNCRKNNIVVQWNCEKFILENICENVFSIYNELCIILKQLIYRCRCQSLEFTLRDTRQKLKKFIVKNFLLVRKQRSNISILKNGVQSNQSCT